MTIISGVNCENTAESIEMAKEAKEEELTESFLCHHICG